MIIVFTSKTCSNCHILTRNIDKLKRKYCELDWESPTAKWLRHELQLDKVVRSFPYTVSIKMNNCLVGSPNVTDLDSWIKKEL